MLDRRAGRPAASLLSDPRVERADLGDIDALIGRGRGRDMADQIPEI